MSKIVIIEDDKGLCESIKKCLDEHTYTYCHDLINSDNEILIKADLIIVDEKLPSGSGVAMVERFRRAKLKMPVLFMTAQATKEIAIQCVNLGVSRFLEKPFSLAKLKEEISSLIIETQVMEIGDSLFLDKGKKVVLQAGSAVNLTATEYKLIELLVANKDKCVEKSELIESIWGKQVHMSENTMDTHLYNLRKKFPEIACRIQNVRNRGYYWQWS